MKIFNEQFRLALIKANLKRKAVMNCLNMSKYEFDLMVNTGAWSKKEIKKLTALGLDPQMEYYRREKVWDSMRY